jgi:DNA-directed RNA polymerase I subunit RPA49
MQKTGATETKLLTHLFALCLRLDDYAVDTALLAKDLSMTAPACASPSCIG